MKHFSFIPKILLLTLLLLGGLNSPAQIKSVERLIEQVKYNQAYSMLYTRYIQDPNDLETLLMLAKFYALPNNKLKNYQLSYSFTKEAEEVFRTAVKEKSERKILRWRKKGIEFSTLKAYQQSLAESALAEAVQINLEEAYTDIILFFTPYRDIQKSAARFRSAKAFDDAQEENTVQSYTQFLNLYPYSQEAEKAITLKNSLLYQQAILQQSQKGLEKYTLISNDRKLQQLVNTKINRFAYEAALQQGTSEAIYHFLIRHPASANSKEALELYDKLLYQEKTQTQSPKAYLDFILKYPETPFCIEAMDSLVASMWREKDIACIDQYMKDFSLDIHYPLFSKDFYYWYTMDGEQNLIKQFETLYPNFMYRLLIEDDLEKALMLENVNLLKPFHEKNYEKYIALSRKFMGEKISLVLMQRTLETFLLNKNYASALKRLQDFDLCFEEDLTYHKLKNLLNNRSNYTGSAQNVFTGSKQRTNPVFAANGKILYLAEIDNGVSNIYRCNRTNIGFELPEKLKTINTSQNEYPFWVDNEDKTMLFGRNGDIYIAENMNGQWIEKGALPYPINTAFRETDASFTPDGSGILFVSDRKNGKNLQKTNSYFHGDTLPAFDIYYARKTATGWDEPINLGQQINSRYCEQSPVLAPDMQTLFFCSDANESLGRLDIMHAKRLNDTSWTDWSMPENMGLHVNSPGQEKNVTYSNWDNCLYFVSGGINNSSNVYKAKLNREIENRVFESEVLVTGFQTSAFPFSVNLVDPSDQIALVKKEVHTEKPVTFTLAKGKTYSIFAQKKDYLFTSTIVSAVNANEVHQNTLRCYSIKELQDSSIWFPLNNVGFGSSWILTPNAEYELKQIVNELQNFSGKIEIGIQLSTSSEKEFVIALQQLAAIKKFLVAQGIDYQKIITSIHPIRSQFDRVTIFMKLEE